MQRVKRTTAVVALPSAPGGGTPGYFANPNPGGGVAATVPGYEWFNSVQEELCAVIAAGGLTLDVAVTDQLLQALPNALASRPEMARSLSASGYQKLPGGLIIQWGGTGSISGAGTQTDITLPVSMPTGVFSVSLVANTSAQYVGTVLNFTATKFTAVNHGGSPANFFYVAIGY